MKNTFIFLCGVTALWFCSCNKAPDSNLSDTPKDIATPKTEVTYVFELKNVFTDNNFNTMGKFRFRHSKNKPIIVDGFGFVDDKGNQKENNNVFRVGYVNYKRKESGEWALVDIHIGYCRNGRKEYPIQPNQDYTFVIPLWPFAEKGTHGIVGVSRNGTIVESKPFETIEIQRIAKQ